MEELRFSESVRKILLVAILTVASIATFMLYHVMINPKAIVHGANGEINVSVKVTAPLSAPPEITEIGPLTGPTDGGTEIIIKGKNLDTVTDIDIGNGLKCEPITFMSETEIRCIMPPHEEGYVDVTVTSPDYGSATKDNGFRYLGGASLPGVPNTGLFRLGGRIVTLYDALTILAIVALWAVAIWLIIWKRLYRRKTDKQT